MIFRMLSYEFTKKENNISHRALLYNKYKLRFSFATMAVTSVVFLVQLDSQSSLGGQGSNHSENPFH